jgi:hypothetical protein
VDRLEAVAARMGIEEDEFLLAMRRIVRVVDIQHDAARHGREAVAEQIDHPERHACKSSPGRRVFQTDNVGWDMRSLPVPGGRPHAILKAGSMRSASRSPQFS